ncbi:MAG: sulfurtransferase TusA family protein, partial [Candidatus Aenigmarchaeota archaeon]|nr:sulfurtransferase TusA family protein [Candidatus Aenigmarchaeota archaeon]
DVKSKRKVKKMKSGEVLEILLDYPLSAERIPETMSSLGHEVLSVDKTGDSSWKILVQIK